VKSALNDNHAQLKLRVYYEDTDAGGVVYYANYLRFFERARTEWLRALGCEQSALLRETGVAFVARSAQLEYLKPAKLDDELNILSKIESVGRAQVIFAQRAECRGEVIVEARMRIASFDPVKGKAVAMPREVYEQFKALL
jgi:acyl-CoA thioester hydrolase